MLETKTLSTQPSFVESIYGHWAEKLARKISRTLDFILKI